MDYGERYHNLTVCSEGVGGQVGHGAGGGGVQERYGELVEHKQRKINKSEIIKP